MEAARRVLSMRRGRPDPGLSGRCRTGASLRRLDTSLHRYGRREVRLRRGHDADPVRAVVGFPRLIIAPDPKRMVRCGRVYADSNLPLFSRVQPDLAEA